MRQRRWIDCTIEYHPVKANVVADALSRKNKATLGRLTVGKERQLAELKEMGADLRINAGGGLLAQLLVRPTYREQILHAQFCDKEGSKISYRGFESILEYGRPDILVTEWHSIATPRKTASGKI